MSTIGPGLVKALRYIGLVASPAPPTQEHASLKFGAIEQPYRQNKRCLCPTSEDHAAQLKVQSENVGLTSYETTVVSMAASGILSKGHTTIPTAWFVGGKHIFEGGATIRRKRGRFILTGVGTVMRNILRACGGGIRTRVCMMKMLIRIGLI
ncbi:hypothetical protein L207DRAFT_598499 [Hyaloscypha variabilis F]|uniref:Uncharacterized protein n=1 Tax=Hyaloscypha variabilis (strain UAMH 11265 / GT02V1 / F) TaxID=1149755 RepID=A0A2J6RHL8_HYAVF|nr:hypothetical protein L207DRAFT_598499 [Hyaloscypha variabilis F]